MDATADERNSGADTALRRLQYQPEPLPKAAAEKDREDIFSRQIANKALDGEVTSGITIFRPWRYSEFSNLYSDNKIEEQIRSVTTLKASSSSLSLTKEGPPKGVVVQDQLRMIPPTTRSSTTFRAPKVSYMQIPEQCGMKCVTMRTDLVLQSLSTKPSSSSQTSVDGTNHEEKININKEIVLRDQLIGSSDTTTTTYKNSSRSNSSPTIPLVSLANGADNIVFDSDTQKLVVRYEL